MYTVEAVIRNEIGLHARPASRFVKLASSFQSDIKVRKADDQESYDAKSIISVLQMGALKNNTIVITAEGTDEEQACEGLKKLIEEDVE